MKPKRLARRRRPASASIELRFIRSAWSSAGPKARLAFLCELAASATGDLPKSGPSAGTADVASFVAARLERSPGSRIASTELYDAYCLWAREGGAAGLTHTMFGRLMMATGIRRHNSHRRFWLDVRLASAAATSPGKKP